MPDRLADLLGFDPPIIAAPMAGGPSTPALVVAAAHAGGLGFLAGGYKTPDALAEQIATCRAEAVPFGVNLFAPNPLPVDREAFRRYAATIRIEADRYGLRLADQPVEDDDGWHGKIDVLRAHPVTLVSFTFGIPDPAVIAALRSTGAVIAQTVTSVAEARAAAEAGVDVLAVQSTEAGGHSGTFTPLRPPVVVPVAELLARIRAVIALPLIAAGGLATPGDVVAVRVAGADAAMVGTVLLRTDEAGTSPTHRAALADPARDRTVVTRAFTGRPARGLRNDFIERYDDLAPYGYPALHHLTSPLRRAAAEAGDADRVHLWAGTGYRQAIAGPAGPLLARLAGRL
jgi:nitronate monooxygenase